ncbi:MAG TPA: ABC transporter ATP-binding protein [Thermodesulfobacteriota bacterium]|nr:ABC transporter ATP-binding protein [Thermodesulfobacteriota bacterium]
MLVIHDIEVYYGHVYALKKVSVHVDRGETVTLIGANGAGKSTILNTISGLVRPASGELRFLDQRIDRAPPHKILSLGVAQIPEGRKIFPDMTIEENLRVGAHVVRAEKVIEERMGNAFALFPILGERRYQLGGTLSGGEQQMLAICRGLMTAPHLLLMDEPSLGLSPLIVQEVSRIIRGIKEKGTTILLVEQNARMALKIADRGYVLETGRIVMTDTGRNLLGNESVKKAYLG